MRRRPEPTVPVLNRRLTMPVSELVSEILRLAHDEGTPALEREAMLVLCLAVARYRRPGATVH